MSNYVLSIVCPETLACLVPIHLRNHPWWPTLGPGSDNWGGLCMLSECYWNRTSLSYCNCCPVPLICWLWNNLWILGGFVPVYRYSTIFATRGFSQMKKNIFFKCGIIILALYCYLTNPGMTFLALYLFRYLFTMSRSLSSWQNTYGRMWSSMPVTCLWPSQFVSYEHIKVAIWKTTSLILYSFMEWKFYSICSSGCN